MGHHQYHGAAGGLLRLDMLPATHLDALHQVGGAAHGKFTKSKQGLETDADGGHQDGITLGLALVGKADIEVGFGDVDLFLGDLDYQRRQPFCQLVTPAGRHEGEHTECAECQPAWPVTRSQ